MAPFLNQGNMEEKNQMLFERINQYDIQGLAKPGKSYGNSTIAY